jgi:hypothetical protein
LHAWSVLGSGSCAGACRAMCTLTQGQSPGLWPCAALMWWFCFFLRLPCWPPKNILCVAGPDYCSTSGYRHLLLDNCVLEKKEFGQCEMCKCGFRAAKGEGVASSFPGPVQPSWWVS